MHLLADTLFSFYWSQVFFWSLLYSALDRKVCLLFLHISYFVKTNFYEVTMQRRQTAFSALCFMKISLSVFGKRESWQVMLVPHSIVPGHYLEFCWSYLSVLSPTYLINEKRITIIFGFINLTICYSHFKSIVWSHQFIFTISVHL